MKLLLDERNLVVGISNTIEYGVWGNIKDLSSWKIAGNRYMMDNNYHIEDIGDIEIPTYVESGQFYFIDGEFKLADECPNEYKDRIVVLEDTVAIQDETIAELVENSVDLAYELSLMELGLTE